MTDVMNLESEDGRTNNSGNMSDSLLTCSDGFYYDQVDGFCNPDCGIWSLYPPVLETAMKILIIAAMVIGTVGGAVVLLFTCRHHKQA